MKLKTKIASLLLAALLGMMIVPQLSFAAEADNGSDGDKHRFDHDVYFLDWDDTRYVSPGQTGVFQTGFYPIEDVQPTGTIEVHSSAPDVLSVGENGVWEAKREGRASISAISKFSDESIQEIKDRYPDYSFFRYDTAYSLPIYVTDRKAVFRMYNPNSGEHFYTVSNEERKVLVKAGWRYEMISWLGAKDQVHPLYRLYNPNAGDHHYTMSEVEANELTRFGWNNEGIAMYVDEGSNTPIYRLYNPNATTGAHHFTDSVAEYNDLELKGWVKEGVAFYANSERDVQQELGVSW